MNADPEEELGLEELGEDDGIHEESVADFTALELPEVASVIASYSPHELPMLILDKELNIIHANNAYFKRFGHFHKGQGTRFASIYFNSLGAQAQDLYKCLRSAESDYYWEGTLALKTRDVATITCKSYIVPIVVPRMSGKKPIAYKTLLIDISKENEQQIKSLFMSLLKSSMLKDNDTGKHVERVNLYSRRIAEELYSKHADAYPEVDMDFLEQISFLAAMHDVGKIGTPDYILNKPGPLNDQEWETMREHTLNGAFILTAYPNPMAVQIARSHHEMWDGKGYPFQLYGTMIPLAARIVTIADVYDALRMERSYKKAFTHAKAVKNVIDWGGSHFDPALIEVFKQIDGEFERIYKENVDEYEKVKSSPRKWIDQAL